MTFAKIMREKGIEPSCPERAPDPKTRARPPTTARQGCGDPLESAGIGTSQTADVTESVTRGPATFVTNVVSVQHTTPPAPRATPRQGEPTSTPLAGGSDEFGHGLTPTTHEYRHARSGSFYAGGKL